MKEEETKPRKHVVVHVSETISELEYENLVHALEQIKEFSFKLVSIIQVEESEEAET
jgi:hypothetical protein